VRGIRSRVSAGLLRTVQMVERVDAMVGVGWHCSPRLFGELWQKIADIARECGEQ
jgi:hypothetical protein